MATCDLDDPDLPRLLFELYEQKANKSEGVTWQEFTAQRFGLSNWLQYWLTSQGRVMATLESALGSRVYVTDRDARAIRDRLPVVIDRARELLALGWPASLAVAEAIDECVPSARRRAGSRWHKRPGAREATTALPEEPPLPEPAPVRRRGGRKPQVITISPELLAYTERALQAFLVDGGYAEDMCTAARGVLYRRAQWSVRVELKEAALAAMKVCAAAAPFNCPSASACGTGSCRYVASAELASITAVATPGSARNQLVRPQRSSAPTFSVESAFQELSAMRGIRP
jgi:hypothetical protein